jgi:hypothetical protein
MNDKIEKLAVECYNTPEFDYKKFAELLIEQCAQIGEHVGGDSRVQTEIKRYFGVKE